MKMIQSILDNDLYSFTMQQAVLHNYPAAEVEYEFTCRSDFDLRPYIPQIKEEILKLRLLKLSLEEELYLSTHSFIKNDYIDFLSQFRFDPVKYIIIDNKHKQFTLNIKGPWVQTILLPTPILAIIEEIASQDIYNKNEKFKGNHIEGWKRIQDKIDVVKRANHNRVPFKFAELGTRRRFSFSWQDPIIRKFKEEIPDNFIGTSNVFLAMKHNVKAVGTMAHEWIMAHQALGKIEDSQKNAFDVWAREYRGQLGIALSDTLGTDKFIKDFDLYFGKLFDGIRQDSGCPHKFTEKILKHYNHLGINPLDKTALYSNSLTMISAVDIASRYSNKINTSFGIGTHISNDMGIDPISIVIKLTKCNGQPIAKLSDDSGKEMCIDDLYLKSVKSFISRW